MITQREIEARQLRQLLEHLQQLIRQPLQHFAFDIFGEQLIMLPRLQRTQRSRLGLSRQQVQAQGRRPALGQFMQVVRPGAAAWVQLLQPGQHLRCAEGQFAGPQFEQLAFQQQTRKVARWPPATSQPPADARWGDHQQLIEKAIEGVIRLRRVVIEHDPQLPRLLRQGRQQLATAEACGVVEQLAQLLSKLLGTQALACAGQPEQAVIGRALTGAVGQQHSLTKAGRANQ